MQTSDRKAFAETLLAAGELYQRDITEQAVRLWWDTLKGYPIERVQAAMAGHIRVSHFMPQPSDLIRYIDGSPTDKAERAWLLVLEAARVHGQNRSVAFDDPLIPAVVLGMGGFSLICMCPTQELHWLARRFTDRYLSCLLRPPDSLPRYLPGAYETHNKSKGYDVDHAVYLVGDHEQASALLHQQELDGLPATRSEAVSIRAQQALEHGTDRGHKGS